MEHTENENPPLEDSSKRNDKEHETSPKEEEIPRAAAQIPEKDILQQIETENPSLEQVPSTENYSEILANKY